MADLEKIKQRIQTKFGNEVTDAVIAHNELTIEVNVDALTKICLELRDNKTYQFNQLIDLCGVDYLDHGVAEWATESTTGTGFSRAVERDPADKQRITEWNKPRFAVVIHLLSTILNQRIRVRAFVPEDTMLIDSVIDIWNAVDWFEREAFDLYGILFKGHPDLRRILTDYGFIGHPFRKDFPLSGNVEMRYDAKQQRVIYEPVDIEPRVLVPKVIREDSRYE